MHGNLFSLAFQGVRRKKKSSILVFMVLLLSFSFAIASLSLLGSMSKTNAEFRLNTYGDWFFGIPIGTEKDAEWLKEQSWVENVGTSKNYGTVVGAGRSNGFGTVDEKLKEIGRLKLNEGTWPVNDNEIAMEADTLGLLGYDYTLGQEITLQIYVQERIKEQKFILCGIIREYTDLWLPNMNRSGQLNAAVVTEKAANQVLGAGENRKPVLEYFVSVKEANWESGREALRKYMATPDRRKTENLVYENKIAYLADSSVTTEKAGTAKTEITKAEGRFYVYAIAAVALLAVICIYIMQLPAEIHSFAILRSIGITKGQMAKLLFMESLLLCVPAMILGIPLGMGLTWLALKLTLYSGSVPVQVEIPFEMMRFLILLWVVMILLSRLIVFCVTASTPLTGKMQMWGGKKCAKRIRSCFIILLMGIFGAVTIFTSVKLLNPKHSMEVWSSYPAYRVSVNYRATIIDNNPCVVEPLLELIEQVPGITNAVGASQMDITLSFDGIEIDRVSFNDGIEFPPYMYAIDSADWDDTFAFGADKEAFDHGELVLLCFPDNESGAGTANRDFILPEGKIQITGYRDTLFDYERRGIVISKPPVCFVSEPTPVVIKYLSSSRIFAMYVPYTVICSNAYVEKLTTLLKPREPGESRFYPQWDSFSGDREVGYEEVYVYADRKAEDLSTDKILAQLCRSNYLGMDNRRQEYMAHIQENLQKLILLCSSGICIALMALLICYGALSLETEQEKRYFRTMRIIGMSSKQMMWKIMGKALFRGGIAVLSGWLFYFGYAAVRMMQNERSFGEAIRNVVPDLFTSLKYVNTDVSYLGILTMLCLIIPLVLSLFAKMKLRKENMLS